LGIIDKIADFDRKIEENYYKNADSSYYLARIFSFLEKTPDFDHKITVLIKKFKELSIKQETLQTRYQDLIYQVFFRKAHIFPLNFL